jgi:hypothetical protein
VFNLKWSAIAGGFGLAASLLVGIISGAGFPLVLVRAAVFGAGFFLLAGVSWFLINNFIPELLEPGAGTGESGEFPGSRVDISVGDGPESALPDPYRNSGEDEVGDIQDLISGKAIPANYPGMDQKGEDGYTGNGGLDFQSEGRALSSGASAGTAVLEDYDLGGAPPDLDVLAGSFRPAGVETAEPKTERAVPERSPTGNKNQSLKGDFHPEELAAAIRTKISRD